MVLRVDQEKGYIDVSKRRVAPEDIPTKEEAFAKAKAVHGIMRHVAGVNKIDVDDLCEKACWPLYKNHDSAFEAFRKHVSEEVNLWDELDFGQPGRDLSEMADKLKEDIEVNLRRRLIQQMLRIRAKMDVSCFEYAGIDAIRAALLEGLTASREDCELKIKLIAHPLFVVSAMCRDRELGMRTVEESMGLVEKKIKELGGEFDVKARPEIVGPEDKNEELGSVSGSGSESGEGDSTEEDPQDETMGAANFDEAEFLKQTEAKVSKDDGGED